jgi:hypothetical protein
MFAVGLTMRINLNPSPTVAEAEDVDAEIAEDARPVWTVMFFSKEKRGF